MVTLVGNTHPLARARFDAGIVPDDTPVQRIMLLLSRSPDQEADLKQLLEDQQTQGSPRYRQWLTPEQFGERFGPNDADVQAVSSWLSSQGFMVDRVSAGKTVIEFSGNVGQVRQAFHTQIHRYAVAGKIRFANESDPQIPASLAPVVRGITSLNNFGRKPTSRRFGVYHRDPATGEVKPNYTVSDSNNTTFYAIGPADFATIYNTKPLQQAGINGRGQTIAVVGNSNINLQDVTDFRNLFGLGPGNTSVVIDGPDPGIVPGSEFEALLDLEWANAVAPGASVVLVSASDTASTSGIDIAALHVVESNLAGVLSLSFGYCEQALGNTGNQFVQELWEQASAQGITVVVATGDSGSASCDDFTTATMANSGLAVNGLASTPFNVAAGGTDFNYVGGVTLYWSSINASGSHQSAKSYIPEKTWNDSCASTATKANLNVCPALPSSGDPPDSLNIFAASGGASSCSKSTSSGTTLSCRGTPKPAWQTGTGVPNDGVRDLPDISLFSAISSTSNSFYVVCMADSLQGAPSCQSTDGSIYFVGAGGTSVAAPTFAGILALAQQKAGTRLGNVNYLLYSLAAASGSSCTSSNTEGAACVFNDVTQGNISVPCSAGSPNCSLTSGSNTGVLVDSSGNPAYVAQARYDRATGLGSVNGANLVNAIATAVSKFNPTTTSLTLNGATTKVVAKHGDPITVAVNVTPTAATGAVSLLSSSGGIDQNSLSGGLANWSSRLFPGGNYSVTAHYPGDGARGASDSHAVPVAISPEPSQTFASLVTFDLNGNPLSYNASTVAYGSPYIMRLDVADSAATLSSTQAISSNCSGHITSCPTGTITLTANGAPLDAGSFPLNGYAYAEDLDIQLTPGTYSVAASYPGDPSYAASTGTSNLSVTKAATTTALDIPAEVPYGTLAPITARATAVSNGEQMTGSISFLFDGQEKPEGGDAGGSSIDSVHRAFTFLTSDSFQSVGTHTVAARYTGDANYAASSSDPVTVTVTKAATSLLISASPNPGLPRFPVKLTATPSLNAIYAQQGPSGTVTFYDNGVSIGTVEMPAEHYPSATLNYTFNQLGTHSITASYSGDSNFLASSASTPVQLVIQNRIPSAVGYLNVSPNPTVPNISGHLIALFSAGQLNAPPLTGAVTFTDNGTILPGTVSYTTDTSGTFAAFIAALNCSFTTVGTHSIVAAYAGDENYLPSTTEPVSLTVVDRFSTDLLSFGASPTVVNQPTNFSVNVSSSIGPVGQQMSGTVTFIDGSTPLDAPVTYTYFDGYLFASMSYTFTTTGIHKITVQYSGDSIYAPSAMDPYSLEIMGPFWFNLDHEQGTFDSSGGFTTLNLNVFNNTSSAGSVSFTCKPDSSAATCSVNPAQLTLSPNSVSGTQVTITLPARTGSLRQVPDLWFRTSGLLVCGVFMGASLFKRRKRVLPFLMLLCVVALLMSCGGGGGTPTNPGGGGGTTPPQPTAQTYHFTITLTSGDTTVTKVFTANLQ